MRAGASGPDGTRCRRLALAAVVLAASCAPAPPPAVRPEPGSPFMAGYHPFWVGDVAPDLPLDILDQLFFFEVELGPEGGLADAHGWPGEWSGLLRQAHEAGVQLVPTVTLHGEGAFEVLFSDAGATLRAVDAVAELVALTPDLRGVHLDVEVFEPVSVAARDGYTSFVAALRARLRAMDPGLGLSVFVLAFDDDDAYNERALSALADYLVVQGYDLHHREDVRAGPLAALTGWGRLNWASVVARYDELGIPRSRLVLGVPLYGYQWPTAGGEPGADTRGPGVAIPLTAPDHVLPEAPRAWREAERHGLRRDPVSDIPYYAYRDGEGGWIQGWFEDRGSLRAKLEFVRSRGLAGVAFFPLAYGSREIWDDVRAFLRDPAR